MRQRLLYQHINGNVVQYIACLIDDAILTMCGEWIQRNISNDTKLWQFSFDSANCTLA